MSTDVPNPHFIKDPKTGKDIAIIDTTGQYQTLEQTDAQFLLTKSKVIVNKSGGRSETYDLSGVQNFYLDRELSRVGWEQPRHGLFQSCIHSSCWFHSRCERSRS